MGPQTYLGLRRLVSAEVLGLGTAELKHTLPKLQSLQFIRRKLLQAYPLFPSSNQPETEAEGQMHRDESEVASVLYFQSGLCLQMPVGTH